MLLRDNIIKFLSRHGVRLNTDLSQHFLVDESILQCIIDTANISKEDDIVEIGPGIGVLTVELLQRAKHVTAIELDPRLIPLLTSFISDSDGLLDKLQIIEGNALSVPLPSARYSVVANIPYHITSPLLRHIFLEGTVIPKTMTLLIQREVAENICDERSAGLLTVLVRLFGTPHIACIVPPVSFLPPPKVDSAVLHIDCFKEPRTDKETLSKIFSLTKTAFSQKRKMMRNTLGQLPRGMERLKDAGIDPMRRPQTLTIDEWIAFAKTENKP